MAPIVSVLIRVWNCEKYIAEAIESVLAQTFQDFEIVVVDDASTDGTEAILQSYAQRDNRIKVIRNELNQGPVKTMNIALQQARGEFVAIQDGDDLSLPHRLEIQVGFLRNYPNIALVGSGSYAIDEEGEEFVAKTWPRRRMGPEEVRQFLKIANTFSHSSVMFRRECIEAIGFYDEFFQYAHDYDMVIRMAERFDIVYYEEPLIKWRLLRTGITKTKYRAQNAYAQVARIRSKAEKEGKILELQQEFNRAIADGNITNDRYSNQLISDAAYFYSIGVQLLEKGKTRLARERFLKALKHRCTINIRMRVLTWYILTFMPIIANPKLVRTLRQII